MVLGRAVAGGKRGFGVLVGVAVGAEVSVGCGVSVGASCAGVLVGAAGGKVLVGGAACAPPVTVGGAVCGWGLPGEQADAITSSITKLSHGQCRRSMLGLPEMDRIERITREVTAFYGESRGSTNVLKRGLLAHILRNFEEQQVRQLPDAVAVRHAVVPQDIAAAPESLNDGGGLVGHE